MKPLELHLELTHACPLDCAPCDHSLAGTASLRFAPLKRLFTSSRLQDLRLISISGGEPLLYPRFEDVVLAAGGAFPGAKIVILTSLYESGRLERFLKTIPPGIATRLHIGSSLDGPPRVHARIRGRADAFARLAAAHSRIKKARPGISTGFTFTVSALNAAHFYGAWRTAVYTLGAPLAPQFLVPNSKTSGLEPDSQAKAALVRGLRRALAEISGKSRVRGLYSAGEEAQLKLALEILEDPAKPTGRCGAGSSFAMLSPEGRFYLCPFHKDVFLGSLETRFERLWTPANARRAFKTAGNAACRRCFLRCAIKL